MKLTLRAARINADKTVIEVANVLGVTTQTIYKWEQGVTQPKLSELKELARLYNIGLENFK